MFIALHKISMEMRPFWRFCIYVPHPIHGNRLTDYFTFMVKVSANLFCVSPRKSWISWFYIISVALFSLFDLYSSFFPWAQSNLNENLLLLLPPYLCGTSWSEGMSYWLNFYGSGCFKPASPRFNSILHWCYLSILNLFQTTSISMCTFQKIFLIYVLCIWLEYNNLI